MCSLTKKIIVSENYIYSHSCTNNPRFIFHIRRLYHDVLKKSMNLKDRTNLFYI